MYMYLGQHLMEGRGKFLIVTSFCWSSILTTSVDTANHVVQLRSGEDTWREGRRVGGREGGRERKRGREGGREGESW